MIVYSAIAVLIKLETVRSSVINEKCSPIMDSKSDENAYYPCVPTLLLKMRDQRAKVAIIRRVINSN